MKYNIEINQVVLSESTLDVIDCSILYYLIDICRSVSSKIQAQRIRDEEGEWTWCDLGTLLKEMPLLRMKSRSALSTRIDKIERSKYIKTKNVNGDKLYIRMTELIDGLFVNTNASVRINKRHRSSTRTNHNTIDHNTKSSIAEVPKGSETSSQVIAPFIFKEALKKMEDSSDRRFNIIALYWENAGLVFPSKASAQMNVGMCLKHIKQFDLTIFTDKQLVDTVSHLKKTADYPWNLATVGKLITRPLKVK